VNEHTTPLTPEEVAAEHRHLANVFGLIEKRGGRPTTIEVILARALATIEQAWNESTPTPCPVEGQAATPEKIIAVLEAHLAGNRYYTPEQMTREVARALTAARQENERSEQKAISEWLLRMAETFRGMGQLSKAEAFQTAGETARELDLSYFASTPKSDR
jgi:truncated hemoglobin YjbI